MSDPQRDVPVSDDSAEVQAEDARAPEPASATLARMLANPRRIRRS